MNKGTCEKQYAKAIRNKDYIAATDIAHEYMIGFYFLRLEKGNIYDYLVKIGKPSIRDMVRHFNGTTVQPRIAEQIIQ